MLDGTVDESSTVGVSFIGQGSGVLTVPKLYLDPLTKVTGIPVQMCTKFKGINLLDDVGHSVTKHLSHASCRGGVND